MPYIEEKERKLIRPHIINAAEAIKSFGAVESRRVDYAITELLVNLYEYMGRRSGNMNLLIGATECAKLEFFRRVMAPYEDEKSKELGDVYNE